MLLMRVSHLLRAAPEALIGLDLLHIVWTKQAQEREEALRQRQTQKAIEDWEGPET